MPSWNCPSCTLLNPPSKRRCQVCNSRRPLGNADSRKQKMLKVVAMGFAHNTEVLATIPISPNCLQQEKPKQESSSPKQRKRCRTSASSGQTVNSHESNHDLPKNEEETTIPMRSSSSIADQTKEDRNGESNRCLRNGHLKSDQNKDLLLQTSQTQECKVVATLSKDSLKPGTDSHPADLHNSATQLSPRVDEKGTRNEECDGDFCNSPEKKLLPSIEATTMTLSEKSVCPKDDTILDYEQQNARTIATKKETQGISAFPIQTKRQVADDSKLPRSVMEKGSNSRLEQEMMLQNSEDLASPQPRAQSQSSLLTSASSSNGSKGNMPPSIGFAYTPLSMDTPSQSEDSKGQRLRLETQDPPSRSLFESSSGKAPSPSADKSPGVVLPSQSESSQTFRETPSNPNMDCGSVVELSTTQGRTEKDPWTNEMNQTNEGIECCHDDALSDADLTHHPDGQSRGSLRLECKSANDTSKLLVSFQTAGTGSSIAVSRESVEQMGRLLDDSETSVLLETKTLPAYKDSSKDSSVVSDPIATKAAGKETIRHSKTTATTTGMVGFQTAGFGAPIAVSKESMEKAGKLLNTKYSSRSTRKPALNGEWEKTETVSPKDDKMPKLQSSTARSAITGRQGLSIGFQTAGNGTFISVSNEDIQKAGKLLDQKSSTNSRIKDHNLDVFQTTSPRKRPRLGTKSHMAAFETAGSGTRIAVSEEKVEEMGKLLSRSHSASSAPETKKLGDCDNAALGRQSSTTSRLLEKPPKAMFQTAGTGASIQVSEDRIAQMGKLLSAEPSSNNQALPTNQPHVLNSSRTAKPFIKGFQTAGSGASITVSEESLNRMERLLNESPSVYTKGLSAQTGLEHQEFVTRDSSSPMDGSGMKTKAAILSRKQSSSMKLSGQPPIGIIQAESIPPSATSEMRIDEVKKIYGGPQSLNNGKSSRKSVPKNGSIRTKTQTVTPNSNNDSDASRVTWKENRELKENIASSSLGTELAKPQSAETGIESSTALTSVFRTAGSGTSIAVSEEKINEMGILLDVASSSSNYMNSEKNSHSQVAQKEKITESDHIPIFQTAGTGKSIKVSAEKMKEMELILNEANSSEKVNISSKIESRGSNASLGRKNLASDTKRVLLDTNKANTKATMAMFRTAGTGASIKVSEEKIEEMRLLLDESATEKRSVPNQVCGTPGNLGTPMNSSQIPRVVSEMKNRDRLRPDSSRQGLKPPITPMFQTAGSKSLIAVSEEKIEEMGKMLEKHSPVRKSTAKTSTDSSSTRTPSISYATPRLVTAAKNQVPAVVSKTPLPSVSMFQTAGTRKAIHVSEEKIKAMETMLNEPSTSESTPHHTSDTNSQLSASTGAKSSLKVNSRQSIRTKASHDFVEANSSSYSSSPLRAEDKKAVSSSSFTPKTDTMSTPHQQLVPWRSIRRATYGITPSTSHQHCRSNKDSTPQLESLVEENEEDDTTARITKKGHVVNLSPKKFGAIDPVSIDFNEKDGKEREYLESNDPSKCSTLVDAIRFGIMNEDPIMCRNHGIQEDILKVNSENSSQVRFKSDGTPMMPKNKKDSIPSNCLGEIEDIRQALTDSGCDASQVKDSWIRNHSRWIIWKLASYERRFSQFLAGKHLVYKKLIQNLIWRFKREVLNGVRPAIRKVLNRDVAASQIMILVVCRIYGSQDSKVGDCPDEIKKVELSDGWYSVKAHLDTKLSEHVSSGLIKIGTKLLVSNARLMGAEDGIDPLDSGDGTNCESTNAALQLTANATRLARWNAKLGFVTVINNQQNPNGRLLLKRVSDVVIGGGNLPAIRLFVQRIYPKLYYEKRGISNSSGTAATAPTKCIFSEQEEDIRRREFEERKLRFIEKLTERIQSEIENEVDESAPDVWSRMMKSPTPEEVYESLSHPDKERVAKWKERRSGLIHRRVRQEVESELETEASLMRESTSFIRLKVHSIDPRKDCIDESATLTLWQPTEEQLTHLKEGSVIEVHNLAVRESNYDGILQLVGNNRTTIEPFDFDSSLLVKMIGFQKRRFLNLFQVHVLSHTALRGKGVATTNVDFDVAGVQIHVGQLPNSPDDFIFYMSDETNLFLRIHCRNPPSVLKSLLTAEKGAFKSYAIRDLLIRPFDEEEQCAVAEFSATSSVVLTHKRLERLSMWTASSSENELQQIAAYVQAGFPMWEQDCDENVFLGYVNELRSVGVENVYIMVDCCGQGTYEWKLPIRILQEMVSSISTDKLKVNLDLHQEEQVEKLGRIGSVLRAKGILWRFQVSKLHVDVMTIERLLITDDYYDPSKYPSN